MYLIYHADYDMEKTAKKRWQMKHMVKRTGCNFSEIPLKMPVETSKWQKDMKKVIFKMIKSIELLRTPAWLDVSFSDKSSLTLKIHELSGLAN